MSDVVGNPEDRFSRIGAQIINVVSSKCDDTGTVEMGDLAIRFAIDFGDVKRPKS